MLAIFLYVHPAQQNIKDNNIIKTLREGKRKHSGLKMKNEIFRENY